MDISKKLAELARLKAEGHLSDESFESLTQLAIKEALENPDASATDKTQPKSLWMKIGPTKALLGFSILVIAVVVFAVLNSGPSDPVESKQYKKLLDKKSELLGKIAELEAVLSETPDLSASLTLKEIDVAAWTDALINIDYWGL
jgi:hypothetical protein